MKIRETIAKIVKVGIGMSWDEKIFMFVRFLNSPAINTRAVKADTAVQEKQCPSVVGRNLEVSFSIIASHLKSEIHIRIVTRWLVVILWIL